MNVFCFKLCCYIYWIFVVLVIAFWCLGVICFLMFLRLDALDCVLLFGLDIVMVDFCWWLVCLWILCFRLRVLLWLLFG